MHLDSHRAVIRPTDRDIVPSTVPPEPYVIHKGRSQSSRRKWNAISSWRVRMRVWDHRDVTFETGRLVSPCARSGPLTADKQSPLRPTPPSPTSPRPCCPQDVCQPSLCVVTHIEIVIRLFFVGEGVGCFAFCSEKSV